MSRRADASCATISQIGRWKNRDFAGNACPFPGPASSDIPTGTINAKSSPLSRYRPHGRSAIAAPAQSAELPKGAAHNIVLVHGAFVDQTSWKPVADILTKKGYNVTLVENPLTSLAADVDATKQALAKQDGKTVLVGHSWGGVVITEAGNDPKVSALVYVSAFAPDVGQSLATLAKSGPATEGAAAIHPDAKGNLYIDPKVFPSAVAADLPLKIAESLANHQLPLNHHGVRGPGRYGRLARQADVLCDHHEGQGDRTRGPEVFRGQDEGPDDGSRRQPCFPRRSREGSRGGDRKGRARGVTLPLPALSRRERARSLRGSRTHRTGNCANPATRPPGRHRHR